MSYTSLKEFRNLPFKIPRPTFYWWSVVIVSHQLVCRIRSMKKELVQFCFIGYVWIYWTPVVI